MSSANLIERGAALQRFGWGVLKAQGTLTLNGATPVSPANGGAAGILANDVVVATVKTFAGTPAPFSITAGANSLTAVGAAGDTSVIQYAVFGSSF